MKKMLIVLLCLLCLPSVAGVYPRGAWVVGTGEIYMCFERPFGEAQCLGKGTAFTEELWNGSWLFGWGSVAPRPGSMPQVLEVVSDTEIILSHYPLDWRSVGFWYWVGD